MQEKKKKHFVIFEDYAKNSQTENARLEMSMRKRRAQKMRTPILSPTAFMFQFALIIFFFKSLA